MRPRGPQRRLLASGRSPGRNVPWSADRGGFRVADMQPEVVHSRLPPRKGPKPVGRQRHEPSSSSGVRSSLAELMTAACVCVFERASVCVHARVFVCTRMHGCVCVCVWSSRCRPLQVGVNVVQEFRPEFRAMTGSTPGSHFMPENSLF